MTSIAHRISRLRSEEVADRPTTIESFAIGVAVLVTYVAGAKVGFQFAFIAEQVTTVWAPTGIAIAYVLLCGARFWPAIWLGAFLVNADTAAPLWTAFIVATGNTLEALAAGFALQRIGWFRFTLRRLPDVLAFVTIAVVGCTIISATIGTTTLCVAGVQPWDRFAAVWSDWWLGDALGALIVTPAILTIAEDVRYTLKHSVLFVLFVFASAVVTNLVFSRLLGIGAHPLEYVVFPLMITAALTGGPPLTASVVLGCSAVTIWNTVHGAGPFAGSATHHNLVLLQTFTGVLATTALLLSAAIAERKAIEIRHQESADALRRREEWLRLAQRAGGVATFEWDFENQVANCSAEFFAILGLPNRDGVINGREWAEFVHPDDRERMSTHLARALAGMETASADYRIVRADGAERWLTYAGHIEPLRAGARMLGTVMDITDRKGMEAELRRHAAEVESASRLKDQFLATLSHELRTPLNAILGYARMLQTNSIAPEKRDRAIDVIERNAAAQNQLIEDLLDISRITRGQVRLDPTPILIAPVLREAVEVVRPAADARRITLAVDMDPFAGTVNADATRLQQVFWNLLTNAVKFTEHGGRITTTLRRVSDDVEVCITDTGAGIAPDFLPFVFEPFRQGDARLGRGHGGLGLGLAISKQLVELHGGTILAESDGVGLGARFVVRLPAADRSSAAGRRVGAVPAFTSIDVDAGTASLAGVDVLVVDDEDDALTLFREALEAAGATVRAVTSAADALRENRERPTDLLVTDLALPGTDGFGLLQAVRQTHPHIRAVAVTAFARLDDRSRSVAAGFHAHVSKPIDPHEFVRTLAGAITTSKPTES